MFGRQSWFSMVRGKSDLRPRTWQGWMYLAAWLGVLVVPYLLLVSRHLAPEAFVWLVASLAALAWDVRRIRRSAAEPLDVREIFVIDDQGARIERLA